MESIQTSIIAPATQQDHETEARVLQTCVRAGVCCIGIQSGFGIAADMVLFQKPSTTLSVPLAAFADPERAIELIRPKLDQSEKLFQIRQRNGGRSRRSASLKRCGSAAFRISENAYIYLNLKELQII